MSSNNSIQNFFMVATSMITPSKHLRTQVVFNWFVLHTNTKQIRTGLKGALLIDALNKTDAQFISTSRVVFSETRRIYRSL